ncbi:DUF1543 domain-containing protein [Microvirga sp. STS03]|nr:MULTISPECIES: DUF1543 domain-containing protein [Pontibacter]MBR0570710.1 DUF1543 domain-containing protein [Microvirga sp. STS03]
MTEQKLFMVMVGCRPPGRNTEQHDVFFGIGQTIKVLIPQLKKFWPGAGKMHVDAWREITIVDTWKIEVLPKQETPMENDGYSLYFLNLGGYKQGEFDEFHYRLLVVAKNKNEALRVAKQSAFYKHTGFKEAPAHIDDKFGVDVDDLHQVKEILAPDLKDLYSLRITPTNSPGTDKLYLGYFPFDKL